MNKVGDRTASDIVFVTSAVKCPAASPGINPGSSFLTGFAGKMKIVYFQRGHIVATEIEKPGPIPLPGNSFDVVKSMEHAFG
ncbi:MAG TPA: hypothetical protein PLN60_08345, partial [Bacillota bacterium]|nr:hypothetical protein [Bacillota bacterium]